MSVAEQLHQTELFKEVDTADLEALVTRMKHEAHPAGQVLFHEGDPGETMYIILSGWIRIYMRDQDGEEITLTHYGKNEIFGELSPIDQRPRSASAAASEPLEVLSLGREDFLNFLDERPQIGLAMIRSLSQRLRNTTAYLEATRPAQFEKPAAPHGEEFRRGAEGTIAGILDQVLEPEPDEHIDVPQPVEIPVKTDQPPEPPKPGGMGIFDRIAHVAKTGKPDESADNEEDSKPE